MFDIKYGGQKAILITTDDFMAISDRSKPFSGLNETALWEKEVERIKSEGYLFIFVVTSFGLKAMPKALRDVLKEEKHAYFGRLCVS